MKMQINRYIPFFTKSKDMLIYGIVSVLLLVITAMITGKLIASYQTAVDTKQQISVMNTFLTEWSNKTNFLNNELYRPIKSNFADNVQSVLLSNLKNNNLELAGFKSMPQNDKKSKNRSYELTFEGAYTDTLNYLNDFHAKDALINIQSLKMQQTKGKIVTTIQYRVYIFE
ncbi:hypothetical protein [Pectinatus frisingensis]|uniref:hypothetical protein n=1 Tax=Pectinatus frisingensis TaxID=865 RepID=UPI0018C50BDA|nr:hypothetical protein [Pectinatus frisingensis]